MKIELINPLKIKIKTKIKDIGYPTNHERYKQCHIIANKEEKLKTGEVYVQFHKKGTLLGSHTKKGIVLISKEVPKNKRRNVIIHEKKEHECMIS